MGSRALVYYFATTILAAIVGIVMVITIHPGDPNIKEGLHHAKEDKKVSTLDAFLDLIRFVSHPINIIFTFKCKNINQRVSLYM